MAYDKQEILKKALKVAENEKCVFMEHLRSFLPCSTSTFYELIPAKSEEMESIKEILFKNREQLKSTMYKKWADSNNASLQIALMKLLATPEQAHRLNGTSHMIEHSGSVNIVPKEWV